MTSETNKASSNISKEIQASQASAPPIRMMVALLGIFVSALLAGLNNRVSSLGLTDLRGELGFGLDAASWFDTFYMVGELAITPFATWFAITFTVRRFHSFLIVVFALLAALLPHVHNIELLLILRFIQGLSGGALICLLMMAALKFLPANIRLHGLALYAMTATFSPNLALWVTAQWTDNLHDLRWIFWQVIPLSIVAFLLVNWGLPKSAVLTPRFKSANWIGLIIGSVGLMLIGIGINQGLRLDWFNSNLISTSISLGGALVLIYLATEWYKQEPFVRLQLLERRNLAMGSALFPVLLTVLMSATVLPSVYLSSIHGFRLEQLAPIGLTIALPQLALGSVVAYFLYKKWVDARYVFALGLGVVALSCFTGTQLTSSWHFEQFALTQALQAIGQPMAVVSLLFLMTSVVQPQEGPYFSGIINTLRVFGTLAGSALISYSLEKKSLFHQEMLISNSQLLANSPLNQSDVTQFTNLVARESLVLSVIDLYHLLGWLTIALIPLVLKMKFIPAPDTSAAKH